MHLQEATYEKNYIVLSLIALITLFVSSCNRAPDHGNTNELTLEERIYGLSSIWKAAEYNFPFWSELDGLDWDAAYNEALSKVISTKDTREYYLELAKFITLLSDGHTEVNFPSELSKKYGSYPFSMSYIEGKHILTNTDTSIDIPLFSEVIKINDLPVQQYFEEKLFPYWWHEKLDSTYGILFNYVLPFVETGSELKIETNGGTFKAKSTTEEIIWRNDVSVKLANSEELTEVYKSDLIQVGMTSDDIAVIKIATFMDSALQGQFLQDVLPKIKDCKGFMIDVRNNPGGDGYMANTVVQAFIKGEFKTSRARSLIYIGTYESWGQSLDFGEINLKAPLLKKIYDISKRQYFEEEITTFHAPEVPIYIDAPVVILENSGTGSAAEDLLVAFDSMNRATIVGTPSFGSTGQAIHYDLPGGGGFRICTRWVTYPDGRDFIGTGVQPHIYAELSLEDRKSGYDSVFDKGMVVLRER